MSIKGQRFTKAKRGRTSQARAIRPFGMKRPPFDPSTGTYLPLSNPSEPVEYVRIEIIRMQVVEEYGDYLGCYRWNTEEGTWGTNVYYVAKPYMLRQTPFDGVVRNGITYEYTDVNERTASQDDEDDITEVITPSYYSEDEIYAIGPVTGGTGVLVDDNNVALIELSGLSGARMWSETSE